MNTHARTSAHTRAHTMLTMDNSKTLADVIYNKIYE